MKLNKHKDHDLPLTRAIILVFPVQTESLDKDVKS